LNTPAHVALNALVLGRGRFAPHWLAITASALVPDLPMVGFYAYQRFGLGTPEHVIWGQLALIVAAPFVLRRRSRAWGWVGGVTLAASALFASFAVITWAGAA